MSDKTQVLPVLRDLAVALRALSAMLLRFARLHYPPSRIGNIHLLAEMLRH